MQQRFFFFFFFRRIATFITRNKIKRFFLYRGECGPKEIRTLALLAATCNCKLHGGSVRRFHVSACAPRSCLSCSSASAAQVRCWWLVWCDDCEVSSTHIRHSHSHSLLQTHSQDGTRLKLTNLQTWYQKKPGK